MIKNRIRQFIDFIDKDTRNENESQKLIVVLRIMALTMILYFVFLCVTLLSLRHISILLVTLPCLVFYLFMLYSSYVFPSRAVFHIYSFITILWIILFVFHLGWDCGVQHFLFPVLVVSFFATYDNYRGKIAYAVILCAFRIGLYIYAGSHTPIIAASAALLHFLQYLNTFFIFIALSIACSFFSSTSQDAEKKLVHLNERLKQEASTDPLTGLINRRKMMEYLQASMDALSTNYHTTFSIALGDIDLFKRVNDTMGHDCGDAVLKELASLFREFMKGKGCVARWGGEEFLFLFENRNGDEAAEQLNILLSQIRKLPVVYKSDTIFVTMTFGLEEFDTNRGLAASIKSADNKLYIGKGAGRNRLVY